MLLGDVLVRREQEYVWRPEAKQFLGHLSPSLAQSPFDRYDSADVAILLVGTEIGKNEIGTPLGYLAVIGDIGKAKSLSQNVDMWYCTVRSEYPSQQG